MSDPHRIVAEISKTWIRGASDTPGLLCQKFEHVIEENRKRGYELEDWKFSQSHLMPDQMVETIIAIFVRTL